MPGVNRKDNLEIEGYALARRLGRGGMADVYLGTQLSLARPVAIKVLAAERTHGEEVVARFEHEARTIARLDHPHIVSIFDVGRTADGRLYYIMPYLPNGDLSTRDVRDDETSIAAIIRALCSALGYAHALGIVHRDVKPANILFDKADRPLLADFGIALTTLANERMTLEGSTIGSTGYMSPEQARGLAADGRSDLYSLGVVAYELLHGELPFQGPNTLAMALAHVEQPIPRLPEARQRWQAFIDRAMAKSAADRFQSAEEMQAALDVIDPPTGHSTELTSLASNARPRARTTQRRWRRYLDLSAAVVLIGMGIAVLILALLNRYSDSSLVASVPVLLPASVAADIAPTPIPAESAIANSTGTAAGQDEFAVTQVSETTPELPAAEPETPSSSLPPSTKSAKPARAPAAVHDADSKAIPSTVPRSGSDFVFVPARTNHAGHQFDIDHAFALGRYEITRAEYAAFAIATGRAAGKCRVPLQPFSWLKKLSWREPGFAQDDTHPVVCVSWDDANAYAQWLSSNTHTHYRLPTHDEWVHAARLRPANIDTCAQGHLGGERGSLLHHDNAAACNDGFAHTAPVGQFKPNALGIHDLIGNVSEWTLDCKPGAKSATSADEKCDAPRFSGTSWRDDAERDAYAEGDASADVGYTTVGFRLLREVGANELASHR